MATVLRETLDPFWVTGLSDGEASFTYSRGASGRTITLYYAVKMTGIERPILERLREHFGVGTLYDVNARPPKPNMPASKTAVMFRVHRDEELAVVVAHFDRHPLQTQKRDVYAIWRLMVLLKLKSGNDEIGCLSELAEEITRHCTAKQPWR